MLNQLMYVLIDKLKEGLAEPSLIKSQFTTTIHKHADKRGQHSGITSIYTKTMFEFAYLEFIWAYLLT